MFPPLHFLFLDFVLCLGWRRVYLVTDILLFVFYVALLMFFIHLAGDHGNKSYLY